MQNPQTLHTYQNKRTTSAKSPRGFDLSKGPNQKTFGTNAQQVQKRQGASTFQKVRTKKPSAQMHNKCKNAKGLRPFKRSEPKNLRHKRTSAKMPRGFDLSKGPNQKTFGTNAQQVQKRQGASTSQKVRTKKPSAQTHNKCKNAKWF